LFYKTCVNCQNNTRLDGKCTCQTCVYLKIFQAKYQEILPKPSGKIIQKLPKLNVVSVPQHMSSSIKVCVHK